MDTCALCRQKKKPRVSHILPRFVGKWLKSTSATGFLRNVTEPDKRRQDLVKDFMLCENCEKKLSTLETYFANKIFYPFLEKNCRSFKYDVRLLKFVTSLSWRTLLIGYDDFKQDVPNLCTYIDRAEETWRRFLLEESSDLGPYEHHIFFFDYVQNGKDLPRGFQWYTLRATDVTLTGNEERVFAYSKFPWMIFVSSIHPTHLEGWYGTRLKKAGEISEPQRIEDGAFGEFLLNRSKIVTNEISATSTDRILKSIERRPERYLKSESLQVSLAEADRTRKARKEILPGCVKELVETIERAIEDPSLGQTDKHLRRLLRRIAADALAWMPEGEASKLGSLMESTILKSKILGEDARCTLETSEIIVSFMVNMYCSKDQQRSIVHNELDKMIEKRKPQIRCIIVFSFNPFEPDLPYETGIFVS